MADIHAECVLMNDNEFERELFALVLLKMVRDSCGDQRAGSVSMTGLQAPVPAGERHFMRRGLTALSEHGALVTCGEHVGLTCSGHLFIIQLDCNGTPVPVPEPVQTRI